MIKNRISEAIDKIDGFESIYNKFVIHLTINGRSEKTIEAYTRTIAQIALHFNLLPLSLKEEELNQYLFHLRKDHVGPSAFKFAIYALRSLFDCFGLQVLKNKLPSIPQSTKLPVVLSKQECLRLIKAPRKLRDRFLIAFMISSGLRLKEVIKLKISDIDVERMLIHVRQSKYNKERYVPLSRCIARRLNNYLSVAKPEIFLFNSTRQTKQFSPKGIQRIIKFYAKACNILKNVSPHILRHTYATLLLENGTDLLTIKKVMGHERIQTTMIYLQVAQPQQSKFINPLDDLYGM